MQSFVMHHRRASFNSLQLNCRPSWSPWDYWGVFPLQSDETNDRDIILVLGGSRCCWCWFLPGDHGRFSRGFFLDCFPLWGINGYSLFPAPGSSFELCLGFVGGYDSRCLRFVLQRHLPWSGPWWDGEDDLLSRLVVVGRIRCVSDEARETHSFILARLTVEELQKITTLKDSSPFLATSIE